MNAKLLYLVLGILIKQTIDEFKAIAQKNADELEKQKERAATYTPVPAAEKGSREAFRAIAEAQHWQQVQPLLRQYARKIRRWRYAPFVLYLLLTIGLSCYALTLPAD